MSLDPLDDIEFEISGIHDSIDKAGGEVALYLMRSEHAPTFQKRAKLTAPRWSISRSHLAHLEEVFKEVRTPSMAQRQQLAQQLGVTTRQIQVWFRNRRQRVRLAGINGGPYERPMEDKGKECEDEEEKTSHDGHKFKEQSALSRVDFPTAPKVDLVSGSLATDKAVPAYCGGYNNGVGYNNNNYNYMPGYYMANQSAFNPPPAMPLMFPTHLGSIPEQRAVYEPPSCTIPPPSVHKPPATSTPPTKPSSCLEPPYLGCVDKLKSDVPAAGNPDPAPSEVPGSPTGSVDASELFLELDDPPLAQPDASDAPSVKATQRDAAPAQAGEGAAHAPSAPGCTLTRPQSIASMMSSNGSSPDTSVRQGSAFAHLSYLNMPAPSIVAPPIVAPPIPSFLGSGVRSCMNPLPNYTGLPNFASIPSSMPMQMAATLQPQQPQQQQPIPGTDEASLANHPAIQEAARKLIGEYMGGKESYPGMAAQMAIHQAVETAVQRHASSLMSSHLISGA